jgi:homoserine O-succinyltransferase
MFNRPLGGPGTSGRAQRLHRGASTPFRGTSTNRLDIALVNNMPDAALDATERQFRALLGAAADDIAVHLTVYSLPEIPRSEFGRQQVSRYTSIDKLWKSDHDGLIVTGTEPRAEDLKAEPYWASLTRVLEWAEDHTYSTILSCLAAHAGILHLDGISRRRLDNKRIGVFECERVGDHPLTAKSAVRWRMPHSRWNDIPEDALRACGYRVLARSEEAGVDAFIKQRRRSLFVFFQGHPEYEAVTLLLEYRRDIGRYLKGERDVYPLMPEGYFDEDTVRALASLRDRALTDRREELLAEFPTALAAGKVTNNWRSSAEDIYHNWLMYICAQKRQPVRPA